jgi:hypothetical protein
MSDAGTPKVAALPALPCLVAELADHQRRDEVIRYAPALVGQRDGDALWGIRRFPGGLLGREGGSVGVQARETGGGDGGLCA